MENNGKGLFYGVIGVATLIVAIIGATFAYFTAQDTDDETVGGTVASAGLSLTITPVYPVEANREKPLVPQLDAAINTAVNASCYDGNNNVVCQVYRVNVENTGTATTNLNSTVTLSATNGSTMTNLAWAEATLTNNTYTVGTVNNAASSTTWRTTGNLLQLAPQQDTDLYLVVWLTEPAGSNTNQNTTDVGSFTGVVTFESADSRVTSTFVS